MLLYTLKYQPRWTISSPESFSLFYSFRLSVKQNMPWLSYRLVGLIFVWDLMESRCCLKWTLIFICDEYFITICRILFLLWSVFIISFGYKFILDGYSIMLEDCLLILCSFVMMVCSNFNILCSIIIIFCS